MLNISEELSHFQSIDIESVEQKIGNIPEDMKNAIDLYNKALEEIANKNEDIAIIALKKAIAIYPAFYEAMNLMGVCYNSLDDFDSARRMFSKVIQMDDNAIRASHYLDMMDGKIPLEEDKSKPTRPRGRSKSNSKSKSKSKSVSSFMAWVGDGLSPENKHPYYLKYILGFVLGALVVCFVWLMVPMNKPLVIDFGKFFSKPVDDSGQVKALQADNQTLNSRLNDAMKALETAKETEKDLQDQMAQYVKWSGELRDLQNLADDGKYKDVVVAIEKNLAGLNLPPDIESEIIALNNACKPKAIRQFYDSAKAIYNSNAKAKALEAYQQSANEYRMAIRIMEELQEKPSYLGELYYYGGKAIALSESPSKEEANTEAVQCFKKVISASPGSKLASYSQSRINEIEDGKPIKH